VLFDAFLRCQICQRSLLIDCEYARVLVCVATTLQLQQLTETGSKRSLLLVALTVNSNLIIDVYGYQ
jgi:hypothetical protein